MLWAAFFVISLHDHSNSKLGISAQVENVRWNDVCQDLFGSLREGRETRERKWSTRWKFDEIISNDKCFFLYVEVFSHSFSASELTNSSRELTTRCWLLLELVYSNFIVLSTVGKIYNQILESCEIVWSLLLSIRLKP